MEKRSAKTSVHKDDSVPNGFDGQAISWATWPMEMWMKWQLEVLRAALPATNGWMERRHDGAEETLETLKKLNSCSDIRSALDIQNEWLEKERKRLESDFNVFTTPFRMSTASETDISRTANP